MTVSQILAGTKDVTRRDWPDSYVRHFKPGSQHNAYSKAPYAGGKKIGVVTIKRVEREPLSTLENDQKYAQSEMRREGGFELREFIEIFKKRKHGEPVRIEFEFTPC